MTSREQEYNKYLMKIAENLDISDTERDKAVSGYTSVGNWLGAGIEASVKIKPQGSFYLGTVIKPVSDKDEYDIDLVCLMENLKNASDYRIKHVVGNRLKENGTYKRMMEPEGKRCWTLQYAEFHMDILPCIPHSSVYVEPYLTELHLTHKNGEGVDGYIPKYSDPYKYHTWFEERMQVRLQEVRKEFAARNNVEVSKVPLYSVKTPLQRAIQLLKRHRDIMYNTAPEPIKNDAPISIIITTLAAHAYNNELSVYEALSSILNNMGSYITIKDGQLWVANPVMPQENFAEKWNEVPGKKREFYRWIKQAKMDILADPLNVYGIQNVSSAIQKSFGENIVKRSFIDLGYETKAAREIGGLYVTGLTSGISSIASDKSRKVEDHTFFGK